jgi:hypothetical protein
MAKAQSGTEARACPRCKSSMEEAAWPSPKTGSLLLMNGVFFLVVFAWFFAGALVTPDQKPSGGEQFLLLFRRFLPLVIGLGCVAWGWMVLTGRRSIGRQEQVWRCPSCEHVQSSGQ